ncbi:MAG: hydantoinase/oxoprolinase family protein [Acetobacteraceae bacterium]
MGLRVAVDIGGTFTDFCIFDETTGTVRVAKTATTTDPIAGLITGLRREHVNLVDVTLLSHGTTVATNALLTRRFPRAAMVCTDGFRDVIEIRRANKEDLWDTYKDVAKPYIPRRDRLTVRERIDAAGQVIEPLDEAGAREVARVLAKRQVAAVAVCFMNSFMNGANERRMKEILEAALPGVAVTTSSDVLPEIFEHERFSTTVVNAVLSPVVGEYVLRLGTRLTEEGYRSEPLVLHSGGGVMTPKGVKQFAARVAGSGIAAGALASRHVAVQCGFRNSIGLDMGGTSCDVSLAWDGHSRVTKDWYIEFGYPIRFPSIEVLTIGAGGGSLAWIDESGSLHNGPQSAGADPGPACYGHGNTEPTNTDAHVVLGRLAHGLAGGSVRLYAEQADAAVASRIAGPLGMTVQGAAQAVLKLANANMADAVRLISISRGHDPRDFALVAFGGAGPLHGATLARELSIPTVIIPPNPGVTSALGCLLVDIQHDLAASYIRPAADAEHAEIEAGFARLEHEAWERMHQERIANKDVVMERTVDMMYRGQWRSLPVPVGRPVGSTGELVAAFHALHDREYNFRRDNAPVDFYRLNVRAIGVVPKAPMCEYGVSGESAVPLEQRAVWFDGTGPLDTPIYRRDKLAPGNRLSGPALVEQLDSTTLIPPGASAEVDSFLNIVMRMDG